MARDVGYFPELVISRGLFTKRDTFFLRNRLSPLSHGLRQWQAREHADWAYVRQNWWELAGRHSQKAGRVSQSAPSLILTQ